MSEITKTNKSRKNSYKPLEYEDDFALRNNETDQDTKCKYCMMSTIIFIIIIIIIVLLLYKSMIII